MVDSPVRGKVPDVISATLRFNDDQVKEYQKLSHVHHLEMRKIGREQSEVLKKYFMQLQGDSADDPNPEIFNEYNRLEAEKLRNAYDHFVDIRNMCNEEQLRYYELALEDILKPVLSGNKPRHPPMHPPGGPGQRMPMHPPH